MTKLNYPHESNTRRVSSRSDLLRANDSGIFIGDGTGNSKFEKDGTLEFNGNAVIWDEISKPFIGNRILVSAGRVDYNYTDLTLDFTTTARYPDEPVGVVIQMHHSRKLDSMISPHIHWMQTNDNTPNILIEYRWTDSGKVPGPWVMKALTEANNAFAYTPNAMQITDFDLPTNEAIGYGLSATFECKIYRDTLNTSGLFIGLDSYVGPWALKYYDIHFQKDMVGSREEYVK